MINTSSHRLFLFLSLFLIISCSNKDKGGYYHSRLIDKDISLEKVEEFTIHSNADSDHTIGRIRFSFATNSEGSQHAFYDEMKKQFLITDNEGEIQKVIGQEGRGHGEIVGSAGFDFDGQNQLVMMDDKQLLLQVFDLDGNIIKSTKIDREDFSMGGRDLVANEGNIYVGVMDMTLLGNLREEAHKSKLAAIYNYDGELVDTVGTYDPTVKEAKTYNLFSVINVDFEDSLLLGIQHHNYRIQLYDLSSKERIAWFGRKTKNYRELQENISSQMPREKINEISAGTSTGIRAYAMSDYIILYFETLTESFFDTESFNDKKGYLAIYDDETYDSYGDIALPYTLGDISNGKIYLIENDNPDKFTIGIYELTEEN